MVGPVLVACTLALAGAESTPTDAPRAAFTSAVAFHVRTTDPRVERWLEVGAAESQTFRDLLGLLAESDLIVHVQLVDRLNVAGQTSFVTSTASVRYVRIEIVAGSHVNEMIALIGHELQHAVEIAHAPRVRDRQTLAQFYRVMSGNSSSRSDYDSVAARVVEDRVRREVANFDPAASALPAQSSIALKRD